MTVNYSEQIAYGLNYARRYDPQHAFRRWPEDAKQAAILGALSAETSEIHSIRRAVRASMTLLAKELGIRRYDNMIHTRSRRAAPQWTAKRLREIGMSCGQVAAETGLSVSTVKQYTRTASCAPAQARVNRAAGGVKGGPRGSAVRWHNGDIDAAQRRQDSALAARDNGWTLKAIQEFLGYGSESAVHYAIRAAAKRSPCHSAEGQLKQRYENEAETKGKEGRAYHCAKCDGWHMTTTC